MNFLLIIAFALGNIWKITFISPDIHLSFLDMVVSLAFLKHRNITKPILLFTGVCLASLITNFFNYSYISILVGGMYLLRWFVYSSVVFKSKINLLTALGITLVITSLIQYFYMPDIRWLKFFNWDDHYYRIVGTFLDPGFTGLLLVFTIIHFTLQNKKLLWLLGFVALALTYSRSSYLAFVVAMAYIAWQKKSWKFIVGILLLFTLTLTILPRSSSGEGVKLERTSSIQARIINWQTAWDIFIKHPIIGIGFNTYRYAQGTSLESHAGAGTDSSLLFVLATTGIVGFGVYLWYLKRFSAIYLIPLLLHSLFLNSMFYPSVMVWLSLSLGAWSDSRTYPSQRHQ